jgi:hypothetical protein
MSGWIIAPPEPSFLCTYIKRLLTRICYSRQLVYKVELHRVFIFYGFRKFRVAQVYSESFQVQNARQCAFMSQLS